MLNAVGAQSYKSELASGNQSFSVKNYTKAEQTYRKASAKEKQNTAAQYNKANSIYKMQSMNEAVSAYQTAIKSAKTKDVQQNGIQEVSVLYKEGDEYGAKIDQRIIESIQLNVANTNE